jgi:hypothetical protein
MRGGRGSIAGYPGSRWSGEMDAADELAKHVALPLGDVCMSRLSSPRLVSSSNIRYWPGAVVPYLSGSLLFFLLYTRGKLQFINNNSIYIFDFFLQNRRAGASLGEGTWYYHPVAHPVPPDLPPMANRPRRRNGKRHWLDSTVVYEIGNWDDQERQRSSAARPVGWPHGHQPPTT